ncbi:hypothetical protein [Aureibacter tunicatorum]|uniref:Uncharacterized protein n=1 Tax=Aureibacter tunicatorum TaxID=866807 RepID=A0AAE3XR85_9BACT|nr:hypothetical protein [Aureibacter tunicatorum]MDR6240450.1 hypothetical protein [Aureibacter tunicatorum]BDD05671.1 hypothetical protein AUTU_31540 [Aureibacter tunicatorum]
MNDLVIGVQQVILYENENFYIELGLGGASGKYQILNDTVFLFYEKKPNSFPDKLIIKDMFIQTLPSSMHNESIKINR